MSSSLDNLTNEKVTLTNQQACYASDMTDSTLVIKLYTGVLCIQYIAQLNTVEHFKGQTTLFVWYKFNMSLKPETH